MAPLVCSGRRFLPYSTMKVLYPFLLIVTLSSSTVLAAVSSAPIRANQTSSSTTSDLQGGLNYEEKGGIGGEMAVNSTSAIPSQSPSPSISSCDVDCATGDACLYEAKCFQYCKEECGY